MLINKPYPFFGALDSLRGIAALIVVIFHVAWVHPLASWGIIQNGNLMVDFFFVLSGFVIYHAYQDKIKSWGSLRSFVFLRLARLYPIHFLFLLVFLGIELIKYIAETQFGITASNPAFSNNNFYSFTSNLFLTHSLHLHDTPTFNLPSWSISTEFYTYLLFAIVMLVTRTTTLFLLATTSLILISIFLLAHFGQAGLDASVSYGYFRCVAGFFIGALTYRIYLILPKQISDKDENTFSRSALAIGLILGIAIFSTERITGLYQFILLPGFALMILFIVTTPNSSVHSFLNLPPLLWLGKISYSIYMSHSAVLWFYNQALKLVINAPLIIPNEDTQLIFRPPPFIGILFVCLAVGTTLIVSHFTYKLIENPLRRKSREFVNR